MSHIQLPVPDKDLESSVPLRHDRAVAYLKTLLLDGGLEPNDVISTEDVGRRLDMSRAPVTDAIKRLVRDGFVTVIPQVGCQIRSPKAEEVSDFFDLFSRSEALITGYAAGRCASAQAREFRKLSERIEKEQKAIAEDVNSGPALRALNRQRYRVIHELAASPITDDIVANMWDRSDFYIRLALGRFHMSPKVIEVNAEITKAIINGEASIASRKTQSYLSNVGKLIASKMA